MNNVYDVYAVAHLLTLGWVFVFFGDFVMGIVMLIISNIIVVKL